jgi:hypothetical protein
MNTSKRIMNILFVAALILALVPVGSGFAEGTPVVTNGFDPNAFIKTGVKFGNFGNSPNNQRISVNTLEQSVTYSGVTWNTPSSKKDTKTYENLFTLSYNVETALLNLSVKGIPIASQGVGDLGPLNYIKLLVNNNTEQTSVGLINMTIETNEIIEPAMVDDEFLVSNGDGIMEWNITGMDLSAGFTIAGKILLTGKQPGTDTNLVEIAVGNTAPKVSNVEVNPIPLYLNSQAALTARVYIEDWLYANTTITSAKYSLNEIDWLPLDAADGFGGTDEIVSTAFTATPVGDHTACVHAWDNLGNLSDDACAAFSVHYVIDSFLDPIDNTSVNLVKAGQTIPIKWRLTDGNGDPINDPTSFVGIPSSYPDVCEGDSVLADVETTAGTSGLQYLGDGYWQYNWKTPKSYSGSCFAFFVRFNSGQDTSAVEFQFK